MKATHLRFILELSLLFLSSFSLAQNARISNEELSEQAMREYKAGKFAEAEHDFREILNHNPSNLEAQIYLGQSLFRQEKYSQAIAPYEKARDLEAAGVKLSSNQHRILVDQLVMSYGMSGDLNKARTLLESAIRQDPEYPLNYYNLACAFAEEGDKGGMLANLSFAFQHKDQIIKGEQMPDPRTDPSFEKYQQDPDFVALMKRLGYK